jgi:diguanylate cyclase (GGDEF)-like protein/PAS domain S-box-containing protein
MKRTPLNRVFNAVYLPMTLLLAAFILLGICVSALYRYQTALDERFKLLELFAANRVDAVTAATYDAAAIPEFWRIGSTMLFKRLNQTGNFIIAISTEDGIIITRFDDGSTMPAPATLTTDHSGPILRGLSGESGRWTGLFEDTTAVIGAYRPIPSLRAMVFAYVKRSELLIPVIRDALLSALASILVIGFMFTTAYFQGMRLHTQSRQTERMHEAIFHSSLAGIIVHDTTGGLIAINGAAIVMFGLDSTTIGALKGQALDSWDLLDDDGSRLPLERYPFTRLLKTGLPQRDIVVGKQINDESRPRWFKVDVSPSYDDLQRIEYVICTFSDITTERESIEAIAIGGKISESIIEGLTITDANGTILSVNQAFTDITGWTKAEVLGKNPRILKSERHPDSFYRALWNSIKGEGSWVGEIWNRRKNGTVYPEWLSITAVRESDHTSHYVAVFRDLTEIKTRDDAINKLSNHDPLTDLPNRALFSDRLQTAIRQAERDKDMLAVLYVDIDRFKYINTTYGYRVGDNILQVVADRLVSNLRKGDSVTRVAADDFLILVPRLSQEESAVTAAETILKALRKPIALDGTELYLDASIGISFYPNDGDDVDSIIGAANIAHNRAKETGAGSFQIFTQALNTRISKRLSLDSRLRKAVERQAFTVFYQPRINARDRHVDSMEALVRWIDEDGTIIPPAEFIPLAEENGLIIPIGEWVLEQALSDLKGWLAIDPQLSVSVNLSARQFRLPDLESRIEACIDSSGVPANHLELEITESLAMADVGLSTAILTALNRRGVSFSLDDFGTGYSSLYYLHRLPIQWLKIDQSFVRDIHDSDPSPGNVIVTTIIEMARNLGLRTIAEGCETTEQYDFLAKRGCSQIQGYLFSRPVPARQFSTLVGTNF